MTNTYHEPKSNPLCPSYSAHAENAADRLYPEWRNGLRLTPEQGAEIDNEALAEYLECEGHE